MWLINLLLAESLVDTQAYGPFAAGNCEVAGRPAHVCLCLCCAVDVLAPHGLKLHKMLVFVSFSFSFQHVTSKSNVD